MACRNANATAAFALTMVLLLSGCTSPVTESKGADSGATTVVENATEPSASRNIDLTTLEGEINGILASGNLVGPDHFRRMRNDLDALAANEDGIRIDALARKLAELDPVQYESKSAPASKNPDEQILAALPSCSGRQFTVSPVDMSNVYEITPMGNLGPPGHTLPTDHMYIHVSGGRSTTSTVPLRAPGEIYIISVTSDSDDIAPERTEYSMIFALCRDVFGYFDHVKGVSPQIAAWLEGAECERFTEGQHDSCTKRIYQKVAAGAVIGEVGHLQGNFDFGAYDYRNRLDFTNPPRYGEDSGGLWRPRTPYITCPLDLYEGETKADMYGKVAGTNGCGKTMYDVKGTLQGNWFYGDGRADTGEYSSHLSFVYENKDPSQAVISIGGTVAGPGKLAFSPQASGVINRRFDQMLPDGKVYCYTDGSRKVVVKMENNEQISVEAGTGPCSYSESLASPYTYRR
ncbi:MAG: hypothetical protein HY365_00760 [Candidatus Aenigmarchaeota archaeon]|nr:hypothetical protein [Candidatus Aenigmarchaeota archaeon]